LGGFPLIAWSIWHAKASKYIPDIFVSTNDKKIASVAEQYGSKVIWRPDELCGPDSTSESAIMHAVENRRNDGKEYDFVIMLQPTSPIRFKGLLDRCIDLVQDEDTDSLTTGLKLYNFFWQKFPSPVNSYMWSSSYNYIHRPMRNDLSEQDFRYFDGGNVYITRIKTLFNTKSRLGGKVSVCPISGLENMQLDTPEDLKIFEAIFSGELRNLLLDPEVYL